MRKNALCVRAWELTLRHSCRTGNIPTELGRCTAMTTLRLDFNQLTGKHFFVQIDRSVYEYTSFVRKNACCVRAWELTLRHSCRTGQAAFRTLMKQMVPSCRLDL